MFASRPMVHPLEVVAAPPPADPPAAEQQEPQPMHPVPQEPQPMQPVPQEPQPMQPVPQDQPPEQQEVQAAEEEPPQGVLMKDLPGMPGTAGALGFRIAQLIFAGIALAVMTSTDDFPTVTAFCYLVSAVILQVGDVITAGITLSAACAAAAITVLIDNDLDICDENHCPPFQSAVAMTFMCWFTIVPTCLLNLFSMARLRPNE